MKPDTVTIIGQPFAIEFVPASDARFIKDGVGRTIPGEQRLLIADGQAPAQERDTVLHEVLHGCIRIVKSDAEDEEIVGTLAPVLLDVLRKNPELTKWLLS